MATKKQHTDFNREVAKYLESIGAETKSNSRFEGEWILQTNKGELRLAVHEPERSEVFSLYGRFEDKTKWNFHSYDANELLQEFKTELSSLLPVMVNP